MINYTIVITFYTGLNILKTNLQILVATITNDAEIVVVNDNPSFPIFETDLLTGFDRLRVINMDKNRGYSAACNAGAKVAFGKALIFMDCDIMPTANWFRCMLTAVNASNNCGALSATIKTMNNGGIVHWGMGMLKGVDVLKPFRDGFLPKKLHRGIYEFSLLTSGCIYVPKAVFAVTKGFDERLYNGYCDLDLVMQIVALGYKCYVDSETIVYHRGKVAGQTRMAAEEDTRALFVMKWNNRLPNDSMRILPWLYQSQDCTPTAGNAYLVNFSRSLFADEYHQLFAETFGITFIGSYELKNVYSSQILLEDHLSWSIVALQSPIIYFCDNYTCVYNNLHWFSYRARKGDFIADRNGNLICVDNIECMFS